MFTASTSCRQSFLKIPLILCCRCRPISGFSRHKLRRLIIQLLELLAGASLLLLKFVIFRQATRNMSQCEIVGTDLLIEFLEVAFNNILHARNLYPAETFVMKKNYSTAVYVSQHPELNEYIGNVLKTLSQWMAIDRSGVSAINMKLFNKDERLIEKYVFNLLDIENESFLQKDPYFIKVEQLLRNLSLQLSMTMSYLKPLPEESTFTIDVDVREWAYVALCENGTSEQFAWILNPELSSSDCLPSSRSTGDKSSLLPLMSVKVSCLRLELFVIEIKEDSGSPEA